jgi:hypothetical protein
MPLRKNPRVHIYESEVAEVKVSFFLDFAPDCFFWGFASAYSASWEPPFPHYGLVVAFEKQQAFVRRY